MWVIQEKLGKQLQRLCEDRFGLQRKETDEYAGKGHLEVLAQSYA